MNAQSERELASFLSRIRKLKLEGVEHRGGVDWRFDRLRPVNDVELSRLVWFLECQGELTWDVHQSDGPPYEITGRLNGEPIAHVETAAAAGIIVQAPLLLARLARSFHLMRSNQPMDLYELLYGRKQRD
jgi:hypothetical protein